MPGDKAFGPDGFPLFFFHIFWNLVCTEVLGKVLDFLRTGEIFRGVNSSFIALIPKNSIIASLRDIRPISLLSSLYKIIDKMLAERLKVVLPDIIFCPQSAFIKDRLITDSVLVTQECIHSRILSHEAGVVIKLDLEKAYDRVE
ncbi:uncharacterized protein LOC105421599 [Amborella trichopoda]|uniref:uncharacterized protein LOC105421599 n=1 Tax=Amborella trichopoda TaxID=13333 RepID=UPI0005D309EB|nr:uncharacterized protein LOC105421599 [Amborella trichopoda]|eukprot:XP_011627897.1 uncharacterized protein LOC105421599 [Amborella trichopoda]